MIWVVGRFILRHWVVFAVLAVVLALFGAGWRMKAKLDADLAQRNALLSENAALKTTIELERSAAQAATEARKRNDEVLPEVRGRTKALGYIRNKPTRAQPNASAPAWLMDDNTRNRPPGKASSRLLKIAALTQAPWAPWSSDRSVAGLRSPGLMLRRPHQAKHGGPT